MTPPWVEVMREAGVKCLTWMYVYDKDDVTWGHSNQPDDIDSCVPDISGWGERMYCLAVLARRVGLDPEGGVCWHKYNDREWYLRSSTWQHCFVHPNRSTSDTVAYPKPSFTRVLNLDTDDPLLALALALKATAPGEGGKGGEGV